MTNSPANEKEDVSPSQENERVTKDDVIVQTPSGARYKSHLINATGLPTELVEEIDRRDAGSSDE